MKKVTLLCGLLLALTAAILWMKRTIPVILLLSAAAIGLLGALAWYSRDEIFSSCALSFVLTATWARLREPKLLAG